MTLHSGQNQETVRSNLKKVVTDSEGLFQNHNPNTEIKAAVESSPAAPGSYTINQDHLSFTLKSGTVTQSFNSNK
jgi:hypothetical protein